MRKHTIRLAILVALERVYWPFALDQLAEDLGIQAAGVSRAELLDELPGLCDHGHVLDILRTSAPLQSLRITAPGRDQVKRDAELSPYIYGNQAL